MARPKSGTHIKPPPGSPYQTPEQEYVESPNGIGLRELSAKWGVGMSAIARWSGRNAWGTKRKRHLDKIEQERHEAAGKAEAVEAARVARELARLRVDAVLQHAQTARALRALIIARMREPNRSVGDVQKLASALGNVVEVERAALGIVGRSEVEVSMRGGVIVAPATSTPSDWERLFGSTKPDDDGEPT